MKINTNLWNKIRYTIYTPVYDSVAKHFHRSRKLSIDALNIGDGDRVLIVGAGTGLDLEFLPKDCKVVATDITPSMVERIRQRNQSTQLDLQALVMDGQHLQFSDDSFDKVILHLILAVMPEPTLCIKEVERVLKPGGEVAVFDKFIRKGKQLSLTRKLLNPFTNLLFSDITRDFYDIIAVTQLKVLSDEEADLNGNFRRIKVVK